MRSIARLALCALAASPASTLHADPFADFRIPDHTFRTGSAYARGAGERHDDSNEGGAGRRSWLDFRTGGSLSYNRDSDRLQYAIAGNLSGSGTRQDSRYRSTYQGLRSRGSERFEHLDERLAFSGGARVYPWERPFGLESSISGDLQFGQSWNYSERWADTGFVFPSQRFVQEENVRRSRDRRIEISAAGGWGRVRDASVVFDVHVLEERLRGAGLLAHPLSTEARETLARLLFTQPAFAFAHQRPDRFFWSEVERVLQDDGALAAGGFDASGLLRILEPKQPFGGSTRLRGWFAGPVFLASHAHSVGVDEQTFRLDGFAGDSLISSTFTNMTTRNTRSLDAYFAGGKAEIHVPMGWAWQLDGRSQITWPLRPEESGFEARSEVQALWFIADRWRGNAVLAHRRWIFEPRDPDDPRADLWSVQASTGLAYFLEDRTSLDLSVWESQERGPDPNEPWQRDLRVLFGVSYRFLGGLDAPGLFEPQRLLN